MGEAKHFGTTVTNFLLSSAENTKEWAMFDILTIVPGQTFHALFDLYPFVYSNFVFITSFFIDIDMFFMHKIRYFLV